MFNGVASHHIIFEREYDCSMNTRVGRLTATVFSIGIAGNNDYRVQQKCVSARGLIVPASRDVGTERGIREDDTGYAHTVI